VQVGKSDRVYAARRSGLPTRGLGLPCPECRTDQRVKSAIPVGDSNPCPSLAAWSDRACEVAKGLSNLAAAGRKPLRRLARVT